MKVIQKILLALLFVLLIPYQIINLFIKGFKTLSLFLSRGFYFYFEKICEGLKSITHISFFQNASEYFKRRQEQPKPKRQRHVQNNCLVFNIYLSI